MASVRLIQNIGLGDAATSQRTSTVNEPTAATSGNNVFVTGNWFASKSTTGGANFALVDPFTALPSAAGGFCCDQIVLYDRSRDIWIWILQYIETGGSNIFRVAISRGSSFGSWYWWDFSPKGLNPAWTDMWFDYPDAALSANHLYITFNAFNAAGRWQRAFVFKLPLDPLKNASSLGYQWWSTTAHGSLRLTQGAATMAARDSVSSVGPTVRERSARSTSTSARIARGRTPRPVRAVSSGLGGLTPASRGHG
jgi:hypothetical protein